MDIVDDGKLVINGTLTITPKDNSNYFVIYKDAELSGTGNLILTVPINGQDYILTTKVNVNANGAKDFTNLNLVVADSTFTNNRSGKTIKSLEVSGGKFVSNYTTYCGSLKLSGGEIEIASGATLKSNDRILTVNGNDTITGSGTLY